MTMMFGSYPPPPPPQPPTITLADSEGRDYFYHIYTWDTAWFEVPGNYGFGSIRPGIGAEWEFAYFGEAENLKKRIPSHERWLEAVALGAIHILAHANWGTAEARKDEERRLIGRYNPILNRQHRTGIGIFPQSGFGSLGGILGTGDPLRDLLSTPFHTFGSSS
jgi:hypothetical protein